MLRLTRRHVGAGSAAWKHAPSMMFQLRAYSKFPSAHNLALNVMFFRDRERPRRDELEPGRVIQP